MKNVWPTSVYVADAGDGRVKIGRSKAPKKRVDDLNRAAGRRLTLCYISPMRDDGSAVEVEAHARLEPYEDDNEFFHVSIEHAIAVVEDVVSGNTPWISCGSWFTMRMKPSIYACLQEAAERERCSMPALVSRILREGIELELAREQARPARERKDHRP